MNSRDIVKSKLLETKIKEYFTKNPSKQSAIFKATLGDRQLFWKAIRENANTVKITEVKTDTKSYIVEVNAPIGETSAPYNDISRSFMDAVAAPPNPSNLQNVIRSLNAKALMLTDPTERERANNLLANLNAMASSTRAASKIKGTAGNLGSTGTTVSNMGISTLAKGRAESVTQEAGPVKSSPAFSAASSAFTQALAPPFDHVKLASTLNKLNSLVGQITDPTERQNMGMMIGQLTHMVDATTQGGGARVNVQGPPKGGTPGGLPPKEGKLYENAPFTSPPFKYASKIFTKTLMDPAGAQQAANAIQQVAGKVTDPQEKEQIIYMISHLMTLMNAAQPGTTSVQPAAQPTTGVAPASGLQQMPPGVAPKESRYRFGKSLTEKKKTVMKIRMI